MTSANPPLSNKNKDLLHRLILLEKFLELKSNECAYYRTKVHLMQMSSIDSSMNKTIASKHQKRSSSEEISQSSTTTSSRSNSTEHRHRRNSLLKASLGTSRLKKGISHSSIPFDQLIKPKRHYRKQMENRTSAQNQNYYEETSKQKTSLPKERNLLEEMLISYLNKHSPSSVAHDKNIQCNENEFHSIESPHTVLKIRLPHQFVRSLLAQQKKNPSPKLKVHLSPELLKKLFQSIHSSSKTSQGNQFTIQSQFACSNHELTLHATPASSRLLHPSN